MLKQTKHKQNTLSRERNTPKNRGLKTSWWFQPHVKNMNQIGSFPQNRAENTKHIWNHQVEKPCRIPNHLTLPVATLRGKGVIRSDKSSLQRGLRAYLWWRGDGPSVRTYGQWFRNPKANHRLDGAKTRRKMGFQLSTSTGDRRISETSTVSFWGVTLSPCNFTKSARHHEKNLGFPFGWWQTPTWKNAETRYHQPIINGGRLDFQGLPPKKAPVKNSPFDPKKDISSSIMAFRG